MVPARSLIVALLALPWGCSSERSHPPLASDACRPGPCRASNVSGVARPQRPGSAKDAGGADGGTSKNLLVEFAVAQSAEFTRTRPLDFATLNVILDADDGRPSRATLSSGSLEFVDPGPAPYWLRVEQTGGVADLMATLLPIDGAQREVTAVLLERRVMEDIADNLLAPVALAPERGHALLSFVAGGLPREGVRVSVVEGRLAYDSGTLFSDGLEATQERGMAALLNLPATPFPGGSAELLVEVDGESELVEIELAQDAVTVVTLSL